MTVRVTFESVVMQASGILFNGIQWHPIPLLRAGNGLDPDIPDLFDGEEIVYRTPEELDLALRALSETARDVAAILSLLPFGSDRSFLESVFGNDVSEALTELAKPSICESIETHVNRFPHSLKLKSSRCIVRTRAIWPHLVPRWTVRVTSEYLGAVAQMRRARFTADAGIVKQWLSIHQHNIEYLIELYLATPSSSSPHTTTSDSANIASTPTHIVALCADFAELLRSIDCKSEAEEAATQGCVLATQLHDPLGGARCSIAQSKLRAEQRSTTSITPCLSALVVFAQCGCAEGYAEGLLMLSRLKAILEIPDETICSELKSLAPTAQTAHPVSTSTAHTPLSADPWEDVLKPSRVLLDLARSTLNTTMPSSGHLLGDIHLTLGHVTLRSPRASPTSSTQDILAEAVDHYDTALEAYASADASDLFGKAEVHKALGMAYWQCKSPNWPEDVVQNLREATELYRQCGAEASQGNVLRLLGQLHLDLAREAVKASKPADAHSLATTALTHLEDAKACFGPVSRDFGVGVSLKLIGNAHLMLASPNSDVNSHRDAPQQQKAVESLVDSLVTFRRLDHDQSRVYGLVTCLDLAQTLHRCDLSPIRDVQVWTRWRGLIQDLTTQSTDSVCDEEQWQHQKREMVGDCIQLAELMLQGLGKSKERMEMLVRSARHELIPSATA